MTRTPIALLTLFLLNGAASASAIITGNFAGYSTGPGADLVGQQGWTSNDSTDDLTFFVTLNSATAAAVGGLNSSPAVRNVDVVHAYGDPLASTAFDVNFSVVSSTNDFPGRDSFGWSFRDSSNNILLRVALEPNINFANRLEVVWYNPLGVRTSSGFDILNDNTYALSVDFAQSGADATFAAAVIGGSTINFNGTLAGRGASTLQTVGADFDVTDVDPGNAGDNFMAFNQFTVIPEPASASFVFLAAAALLAARRPRRFSA